MPHKVPTESLPITASPNVTIRPSKRAALFDTSRAEARIIKQRLCELEQELEDRDALKSHPEDMRILFESFASVKTEFQPLDGQSWDTPEGRERLARDEAARNRANHLTPARGRRLTTRRSRASIRSSTVFCKENSAASRSELLPTTDVFDLANDDVAFSRPTTPLPHDAAEDDSSSRDLQRTPLPSLYRASTDGDRMVVTLEHPDDDADADATFYAELATPQALRADDPKSPWLMRNPRLSGRPVSPQKSPSRLPRPTGNSRDRRTPSPVFSKPKSSAARAGSSTAAVRTPSKPAKIVRIKSRTVLASSQSSNYGPAFTAPSGSGTASRAGTSPQKRPGSGLSSTTTRRPGAEPRSVEKKSRLVKRETPTHSRVFFPRTEEPGESSVDTVKPGAIPERHRTETFKASSLRRRTFSQSQGSGSQAKAWK
ncbi:hypothetical protein K466DRAFT_666529 [Polyporus arcularius HHB13444]|uniref:Uncharacterized protein n=1 Tax=Polyporus arcularius HHB13444 TaxID=1314778 RepID=A0A5C3NZ84_9APHY|nr:hypothetical protein K466DRAFT_666529 [Polyporus arcularius HHB13444]